MPSLVRIGMINMKASTFLSITFVILGIGQAAAQDRSDKVAVTYEVLAFILIIPNPAIEAALKVIKSNGFTGSACHH